MIVVRMARHSISDRLAELLFDDAHQRLALSLRIRGLDDCRETRKLDDHAMMRVADSVIDAGCDLVQRERRP